MERVGGLSAKQVCLDMPDVALRMRGDLGRLLLVRGRRMRRLRPSVLRLRDLRLQLVVPVGRRLLRRMSHGRVTERTWLEMPAVADGPGAIAVRPKYPVDASALLFYRDANVYVAYRDDRPRADVTAYSDVRLLTGPESHRFEASLPYPLPAPARSGGVRLGDLVHRVTRRLGIAECDSCRKRKRVLDRIVVWGWWRRAPVHSRSPR